jgi:tetratricopeptide (TPR) repeat protein
VRPEAHRPRYAALAAIFAASLAAGCTDPVTPENGRSKEAEGWYQRARRDFKQADFAEAHDSINKALGYAKDDPEVRTLAAEVSIALLDYAEVLRLLKGVRSTDAARLRGRAYWYKGDLEAAADELDTMLNDPDVKDDWAKATSRLARGGLGRTPFSLSGGMLAAVEMVHVSPVAPWFVVPVEIDGESALAMIATNTAEVVIDSAARPEPSWVSLRFGDHFEVKDVPALPQDLSGISKELQAPIKALLGVNLLRHLNATIDFSGRQFVARSFAPPPPPSATRIDLFYVRGGGLVVRGTLGGEKGPPAALMVDTSKAFPIALDLDGWKKIGVDATQLKLIPGDPEQKLREGVVPLLRLGAFDMPRVSGLYGLQMADLARAMQIDLDGIVGAGLLYPYRCTFADGGRLLWLEDDSDLQQVLGASQPAPAPAPAPAATPAPPPAPTNQRELPPAAGPGLRLDQPPSPAPAPAPKK